MKKLYYFSLSGNSEYIALELSNKLNIEPIQIREPALENKGKFAKVATSLMSISTHKMPVLDGIDMNIENEKVVLICSPTWAGTFANPIKALLKELKIEDQRFIFVMTNSSKTPSHKVANDIIKLGIDGMQYQVYYFTSPKKNRGEQQTREINEIVEKVKNFID